MSTRRQFLQNTIKTGMGGAMAPLAGSVLPAAAETGAQSGASQTPQRKPNILVLFPDQWRFDWMSTNPLVPIKTPNIDRLARSGTRFTSTIVASPLCAPSRACLAAGMAYDRTGVASNSYDFPVGRVKTLYSMLRDSGYHVLGCGKMDLAKGSLWWGLDGKWRLKPLGFSDGINNAGKMDELVGYRLNDNQPADPYGVFLTQRGLLQEHLADFRKRMQEGYAATFPTPLPDDAYCDNWLGQNGLNLIAAAPKDKPWFIQVNWTGPHDPEDITRRMETGVRGLTMPPPNGKNQYDTAVNQTIRQNYTAMCENVDRNIGLYLHMLERTNQLDNTLIVFSSDHGEMLGDHGRWGKLVPFHASASVPLIVSGPGIAQGKTSTALVNHVDLAATYLDYAGVSIPTEMDSKSLRPVLEGQSATHRDVVFSALGGWRMVYDGQYKAITGYNMSELKMNPNLIPSSPRVRDLPPVVFDLASDPGENNDLYPSRPAKGQQLLQMLKATPEQDARLT